MSFQTCHSWIGFEGKKCAAVEIYVIASYERFVKIWNLASFFTRKSLWCLFMKASMRSNWPGLKNCSWGQVVTQAWILLWCIVSLRFTNDINSIFFPLKFAVFLFSNRRAMGSHILHSSIGLRAKNALQLTYTWFPAMSDLLRFEIWQVLLVENLCDVCLWKHRCLKIGAGLRNCSWGQVVTEAWILLWCIVCLRFTNDINSIFFPLKFSVFLFSNRRAMGSHILHLSIGLEG